MLGKRVDTGDFSRMLHTQTEIESRVTDGNNPKSLNSTMRPQDDDLSRRESVISMRRSMKENPYHSTSKPKKV